jgi:hypothetical protein
MFSVVSGGVFQLTGRAIDIAQDAYRGVVAKMHRLTGRGDADTEADAQDAIEERALAEEAARAKLATVTARREEARRAAAEKAMAREMDVARARSAAQEAANVHLTANKAALNAAEGKPKSGIEAKEQADRAEADLAQEGARSLALEQQLAARGEEQKLLAEERARNQALEQQPSIRENDEKLLAHERARSQALERQLEQKLLAQELERQLAVRGEKQKLLAQERARSEELEQQLSIRQHDQKLPAPEERASQEAAPLVAQARLLLAEGNIVAARSVLQRAAESGSALALFLLAETYDSAILSAWGIFSPWGIFGRRGDVTKAQEFYTKAVAGGVHEAKYRLSALR